MWFYTDITREEFEKRKDYVEQIIGELGGVRIDIELHYTQKTILIAGDDLELHNSGRQIFQFQNRYFRVGEVLFRDKPFIVLECGTYEELRKNTMEDTDPFPFDLSDDDIIKEIKYSLGIEPYPTLTSRNGII